VFDGPIAGKALHPLAAGGLYLLLRALAAWAVGRRRGAWGQVLGALGALGYLAAGLAIGVYSMADAGIGPIGRLFTWPWLAGMAGGMGLWIALLWSLGWREGPERTPPDRRHRRKSQRIGTASGLLFRGLTHEATLAVLRASCAPLMGVYWGSWLGLLLKQASDRLHPTTRQRLAQPGAREVVYLDAALDWASAALCVLSGSLWPSLLSRGLGYALCGLARALQGRRALARVAVGETSSAQD